MNIFDLHSEFQRLTGFRHTQLGPSHGTDGCVEVNDMAIDMQLKTMFPEEYQVLRKGRTIGEIIHFKFGQEAKNIYDKL